MNHYHTTLKEVLFTFGVDGPRYAEMPRTKMKIRERRKKKSKKAGSDDNITLKRDI